MKTKLLNALLAASITVGGLGTVAFADTGSSFDSQYQAKTATEAQLLQTAQGANSTDPTVIALLSSVHIINQQVSALYISEQALATAKSSIPAVANDDPNKDQLAKLDKERNALLVQSNNEWKTVQKYNHHKKDKQLLNKAIKEHDATQKKLDKENKQIKEQEGKVDNRNWQNHPYDYGFAGLQESILRLQDSSIHYTQEAINLEQADSTASSSSTSGSSTGSGSTTGGTTGQN